MTFREPLGRSPRSTEAVALISELSLEPYTQNTCLATLKANLSRLADTVGGAFYRVLSDCIQRTYIDLHAAASLHGYFDCDSAVAPLWDPSGRKNILGKPWPREEASASAEPDVLQDRQSTVKPCVVTSQVSHCDSTREALRRRTLRLRSSTLTWLKGAAGVSSAAAVGALGMLLSRSSSAQFVIAVSVVFTVSVVASCAVVWGQLELTVRRSSRQIYQLLTYLNLQHKLTGETVRWIHELEVTFKAFPGALGRRNKPFADAFPSASSCTSSQDKAFYGSSDQFNDASINGPSPSKSLPCSQNGMARGQEPVQLQPSGSPMNEPCALHLRMRFSQVLDWQQRIFCCLYEDIVRLEPGRQFAWKKQISEGPWSRGELDGCRSCQFDGSLRALKEMAARSWLLHSKLLGGIQVSLRHMLLTLDSRLLRPEFAVKPRLRGDGNALPSSTRKTNLARRTSRILKQAFREPEQHPSSNRCGKSLREEIDQATKAGGDRTGDAQTRKSYFATHGCNTYTLCSAFSVQRHRKAQESSTSTVTVDEQGALESKQCTWSWILFKALGVGIFGGYDVLEAVVDGIRALWWLWYRIYRLGVALSAACRVAEDTTNALRMILEEDWALCPLFLPQPRWGDGMRKRGKALHKYAHIDAKSLKLMRCAVSPPRNTSQYTGTLFKIASEKHRSALAAMSRNVAASLALLRLPATAYSCHCSCPGNGLSEHGKIRTACSPVQGSMDSVSSADTYPMYQRTPAEDGQEGADAELCECLQLALRHLKIALDEGEKLKELLRFNGEKLESSKTCGTAKCSEDATSPPAERDKSSDEEEQPLQPVVSTPVQCLEVYTAVGQDSITNKRRFQEEEGLKEAFAEDDPTVRERSQITLRELELRLKRTEKERQRVPRVLKELALIAFDNANGADCEAAEDRAVVRVVKESNEDMGCFSAADHSAMIQSFPLGKPEEGLYEKEASLCTNVVEGDVNAKCVGQQGFVGIAPLHTENGVIETASQPEDTCRLGGVGCLDDEQVAFQIPHQELNGCSAESISVSPENLATQSLMSQLRGVLKRQKRTLSEGRDSSSVIATSLESPPGSKESGTLGDSMEDEEWSACDVVEGPSCAAEVPTWVAAPSHLGDSDGDGLNGQKEGSM